MFRQASSLLCLVLTVAACGGAAPPPPREFTITGQVLAVRPDALEVTIRHDDIPGFMDAMTMPFKVKDRGLLAPLVPGDLVRGRLVVADAESYLSSLEKTGTAPLPAPTPEPAVTAADLFEVGQPVPDVTFLDEDGGTLTLSALRGSVVALTFIYTRCPLPEFCPLMDRRFAAVQRGVMADPPLSRRTRLLTISFDPEHDTPAVLKAHAAGLGADRAVWRMVTGNQEAIDRFSAGFGLIVMRDPATPGAITHNLRTALLDAEGRLAKVYHGSDWTPEEVLGDLRALIGPGRP